MIDFLKYIIFGIVQGIVEPLPISSKGHVLLTMNALGVHMDSTQAKFFLAFIHLGSLASFFIIYWKTIARATTGARDYFFRQDTKKRKDANLFVNVIIAFLISASLIFTLDVLFNVTDKLFSGNSTVIAIGLLITACFLIYIEFGFHPEKQTKSKYSIKLVDAIMIGLFQVMALVPGVTRSGSTLLGGMSRKMNKSDALDFSFLLFIPTILMANVFTMIKATAGFQSQLLPLYIASLVAAFFATFIGYRIIRFALKHNGLRYFAVYAIIMAILIFIFSSLGGFFGDIHILNLFQL